MKRWMTIILTGILAWVSLTPVAGQELDAGLETPGVLRIGMEANYAPFNWSQTHDGAGGYPIANSPGEYANGYDLQIARLLAEALDLELEIIKLEWEGLPPALESGMIDGIIAGMSPTPERREAIDFSDSYYDSEIVVVLHRTSEYAGSQSLEDLAGAQITGQLNTFHYDLVPQIPNVQQMTAMDSFPTMITATLTEKIDGYISEKPGAMAAVAANEALTYVEFPPDEGFVLEDVTTDIAVGLRKGSPLRGPINVALAEISREDRDAIMQDMVDLNQRAESSGFWAEVADIWQTYGGAFIRGAATTLLIATVSTLLGFLIGLLVALVRSFEPGPQASLLARAGFQLVDWLLVAYIEIFRGTPMMVQAMLIFYGSKLFLDWDMSALLAAFFIVSINTGAYLAEVIRGGIRSVDSGQQEASKALGMSHVQSMTYVILPQAIRNILPTIGNEWVINIKDTSVLNVIAVTELFFVARSVAGSTYRTFQTFLITSLIYFVMTFVSTRLLRFLESRMDGHPSYRVHQSSSMPS